jgi:bifunctional UDP-N-acetylglucosamine pyrophosphorylase/glucosamine-1-phosphate N-acetyltransferase
MQETGDLSVAAAIILAAGEGTRMKSGTPKVLHEICGRSMLGHVVAAVRHADPAQVVVVTGKGRSEVEAHLSGLDADAIPVFQATQDGTGHAVRLALEELDARAQAGGRPPIEGTVIVAPGDTPLLSGASVRALAAHREKTGAPGVLLSAHVPDPTGYGRVVRDRWGHLKRIVEHKDATETERALTEVNSGVYAFDAGKLRAALAQLTKDNAQGEEYLPDVVRIMVKTADPVGAAVIDDWHEIAGVNDRVQLAQARALLRDRILIAFMRAGVTVIDPATTWSDVGVVMEPDCVVLPNTMLLGSTRIATGARIGPNCELRDTIVGAGAIVRDATCEGAEIGPDATVGPYTYLRRGTRLARGAKVGGFVETKNAQIGEDSKVPHLSYVGDAVIGARTNVGAATVFVNYDGVEKHTSVIGDDVRIGSDTMLVAPITIGDGAYTAAGSVIVDDVPPGALAVARGHQRNVEGWVEKRRPGTASARSARRAAASGAVVSGVGDNGPADGSHPAPTGDNAPADNSPTQHSPNDNASTHNVQGEVS